MSLWSRVSSMASFIKFLNISSSTFLLLLVLSLTDFSLIFSIAISLYKSFFNSLIKVGIMDNKSDVFFALLCDAVLDGWDTEVDAEGELVGTDLLLSGIVVVFIDRN